MFRSFDHHQGVFSSLLKITLINISFDVPILKLAMWQHVCNTKYIYYLPCQIYIFFCQNL